MKKPELIVKSLTPAVIELAIVMPEPEVASTAPAAPVMPIVKPTPDMQAVGAIIKKRIPVWEQNVNVLLAGIEKLTMMQKNGRIQVQTVDLDGYVQMVTQMDAEAKNLKGVLTYITEQMTDAGLL